MDFYRKNFNDDWKFTLDENNDLSVKGFDESNMESLCLPHDWSIIQSYNKEIGDGATGYLTGGIGWYRKHFNIENTKNKVVYIHFDGVYNNSELWVNGNKIGKHPYGYSPFYFDITEYLTEADNVIAVKVDRTRYIDSRWYTGSGIYRDVELCVLDKLHFPLWSSFVSISNFNSNNVDIDISLQIKNNYLTRKKFYLILNILDKDGQVIDQSMENGIVDGGVCKNLISKRTLKNPILWDLENPYLYSLEYKIILDEEIIDINNTTFGIRHFNFDKEKGFFLNEVNMKIKGVCLHHDGGLVGSAVPKDVWRRRLLALKSGGCNAIRIAHNPSSSELLDLCDEIGILVQDEFFDEWDNPKDKRLNSNEQHDDYISRGYTEHFQDWAKFDLTNTMLSHRNHPSIFQWSIGNEVEWTYPRNVEATGFFDSDASGNYFWTQPPNSIKEIQSVLKTIPTEKYDIGETAKKLSKWTKEIDTTRPVIANCILPSVSFESGYTDALDIVGFSYRRVMYDYAQNNYPDKICMGTENLGQYHDWKAIEDRDFISGTFLWTGIDYIGEAHRQGWPQKALSCGLLDLAGFKKPSFHMMKTLWSKEPHVYIATQVEEKSMFKLDDSGAVVEKEKGHWENLLWEWHNVNKHWNYSTSDNIIVEVYSNCKEVELFLNGDSLGTKLSSSFEDGILKWLVPYQSGDLKAIGLQNEKKVLDQIITSGTVSNFTCNLDKYRIFANNRDCIHVDIQLTDKNNNPVYNVDKVLSFEIDGCRNLGVDNGSTHNVQDHKSNKIMTNKGRALLILQATYNKGPVKLKVTCESIEKSIDGIIVV